MNEVLLIIHLFLAVAMVAVILIQRSEGGALGIGGGTMGGLMTTRGSANLLTRTTGILAGCFLATSLLLAVLSSTHRAPTSILDRPDAAAPTQPAAPAGKTTETPASKPAGPSVPLAK